MATQEYLYEAPPGLYLSEGEVGMDKRLHIYYSGSVQGVGFRFVAESAAQELGVTGWVKNLEDGRVEVICEGKGVALNKFLDRIKDIFGGHIRDARIEPQNATGEFEGFDIKFF